MIVRPMLKFSANLSMMFCEHPFLQRLAAASAAGFEAVEFTFPYEFTAQEVAQAVKAHNLSISVLICRRGTGSQASADLQLLLAVKRNFVPRLKPPCPMLMLLTPNASMSWPVSATKVQTGQTGLFT